MDKNLRRITGDDRLSKYVDSEYLGSDQLNIGEEYVLTIDKLFQGKISTGGEAKQKIVITFRERTINGVELKPMVLNATNRKTLIALFGSDSAATLEGKRIILYVEQGVRDPKTGGKTNGLRIRQRRPADNAAKVYVCADCGAKIEDSQGFTAAQIAGVTEKRYGKPLCAACSAARKAAANSGNDEPGEVSADE